MKEFKKSIIFVCITLALLVCGIVSFFFRSKQTTGGIIAWVAYFACVFGALFFFFVTLNEYRRAKAVVEEQRNKRKKGGKR